MSHLPNCGCKVCEMAGCGAFAARDGTDGRRLIEEPAPQKQEVGSAIEQVINKYAEQYPSFKLDVVWQAREELAALRAHFCQCEAPYFGAQVVGRHHCERCGKCADPELRKR